MAREVQAFIDVPLDADTADDLVLVVEDYDASVSNRQWLDDLLDQLSADVPDELNASLSDPDARFVELTQPDDDHLLRRADILENFPG